MQAAVAKGFDVDEDKVSIDYASKTVSIDIGGADLDMDKVANSLEGTRFSLAE